MVFRGKVTFFDGRPMPHALVVITCNLAPPRNIVGHVSCNEQGVFEGEIPATYAPMSIKHSFWTIYRLEQGGRCWSAGKSIVYVGNIGPSSTHPNEMKLTAERDVDWVSCSVPQGTGDNLGRSHF